HSGEVRTAVFGEERDVPQQMLVTLVPDRRQPPLSATTTLGIALLRGFSNGFLKLNHVPERSRQQKPLAAWGTCSPPTSSPPWAAKASEKSRTRVMPRVVVAVRGGCPRSRTSTTSLCRGVSRSATARAVRTSP
ncbi:PCDBG protein, partial [Caloenas nicobarica]|nr:PCDBG protein [Caloenas nicobarica]